MTVRLDPSLVSPPTQNTAPRANATDFDQFAALRRGARADDPNTLREVARQFESLFTKMMLESMREASFGDPLFGSDQVDMYQDMMDDQLAVEMSRGQGLGLADMLIRQLSGGQMSGAQPANIPTDKQKFVDDLMPIARNAARELGVDPRLIVAQAALETGWGRSLPADNDSRSNNLFGIKAGASWGGASVASNTYEYESGVAQQVTDRFRAYGSAEDSMKDYVALLRDNPRYVGALNTGSDARAFATALQRGGYATDPHYAQKLVAVFDELVEHGVRQPLAAEFKARHETPISPLES